MHIKTLLKLSLFITISLICWSCFVTVTYTRQVVSQDYQTIGLSIKNSNASWKNGKSTSNIKYEPERLGANCLFANIAHEIGLLDANQTKITWKKINSFCQLMRRVLIAYKNSNLCWTYPSHKKHSMESFCFPRIFLAGFPKSGTTDLFYNLVKHPALLQPIYKEPHFWPRHFVQEEFQLYTHFYTNATREIKNNCLNDKGKCIYNLGSIDASASTVWDDKYWYNEETDINYLPYFLTKLIPNMKVIIIMRDPVHRLWSDYWYFHQDMVKSARRFDVLVRLSIQSFRKCLLQNKIRFCINNNKTPNVRWHVGLYYIHLLHWIKALTQDNILLLKLEDYSQNKTEAITDIFSFLDLDAPINFEVSESSVHNSNANSVQMWTVTRQFLQDFYNPYNKLLSFITKDRKLLWDYSS